jgi:hypothetical protein
MHRQPRAQIHLTKPSSQVFMRLITSKDQPTAAVAAPHAIVLIMPLRCCACFAVRDFKECLEDFEVQVADFSDELQALEGLTGETASFEASNCTPATVAYCC